MTNLPTLYRNIMDGLPSKITQDAFLWASERTDLSDKMLYGAEQFACEVHEIVSTLVPVLDIAAKIHGADHHYPDLMAFILKRHVNWRFGGNQSVGYLQ